jgi:3-hydroxybutyryl-CoA dehydrogenase
MHFFNPVAAMKLVELVRGETTSDDTVRTARAFAESLGKTAIVVHDTPGFATSRLGVVLGLEAMRMLEQGVATAEDIDRAMELGYNHPIGPLRLTDVVGLDVRLAIADHLYDQLGQDTYKAPEILRQYVSSGKLGKKSGEGFYNWNESA